MGTKKDRLSELRRLPRRLAGVCARTALIRDILVGTAIAQLLVPTPIAVSRQFADRNRPVFVIILRRSAAMRAYD